MSSDEKQPQSVTLSPLESVAKILGSLQICTALEQAPVTEETAPIRTLIKDALIRLMLMPAHNIDTYLKEWAPEEELFQHTIAERSTTDPNCFLATYNRVLEIRAERGTWIKPPEKEEQAKNVDATKPAHFSALENYTRVLGNLEVLANLEIFWRRGAIPDTTYRAISALTINGSNIDKIVHLYFPDKQLTPLLPRIDEPMCLFSTYARMVESHAKISVELASGFVERFLEEYAFEAPKVQVQSLLYTLRQRLIARQEAVEAFQYEERLKTIDENIKHLLDTLRQYGIDARTYDDAQQQCNRKFPPSKPVGEESPILKRCREHLKHKVGTEDMRKKLRAEFPDVPEAELNNTIRKVSQDELGRR